MAINSIWDNDFYNEMPVPKWSFEMDFSGLIINSKNREPYSDILNKAVVSCSWPERSINSVPVYYAGIEGKLPGRASNSGSLEIKFNENIQFNVTKILEEIFHAESYCDAYFENKGGYSFNKNFNKIDRIIRMLILNPSVLYKLNPKEDRSEKRAPIEIQFRNCWIEKIGSEDMSYDSENDVITRSATFSYDYFKVLGGTTSVNDTCIGDR